MFDWIGYVLKDYSFVDFAPGALVLDVGCGNGMQLQQIERRGCLAMGTDIDPSSLAHCRSQGLRALQACAEQIPVKNARLDGLVCKVAIPYLADEPCAFREMGRVLKSGAVGYCCYHGAGYYLQYLLIGSSWTFCFYGLRTHVNTWLYAASGRRFPGFLGDTIYQSRRRLVAYYHDHGIHLLRESPAKPFLGLLVFLYHTIKKASD